MSLFNRLKSSKTFLYFIELLIVFAGVYLAFLLNNYQESKKTKTEKVQVLTAVKYELEQFRLFMPGQADYMERLLKEWNRQVNNDTIASFYSWRYLEPQYNYQIIEYALNRQDPDIISLELYTELSKAYTVIKHLEQSERRMTEFGDQFKNLLKIDDKNSDLYKERYADNRFFFYKFRNAAHDRAISLKELGQISEDVLKVINTQFTKSELKEIELTLLKDTAKRFDEDEIQGFKEVILNNFENFTEQELDEIFDELQKTNN